LECPIKISKDLHLDKHILIINRMVGKFVMNFVVNQEFKILNFEFITEGKFI